MLRSRNVVVRRKALTEAQISDLAQQCEAGKIIAALEAETSVPHGTIQRALKNAGVEMRPRGFQNKNQFAVIRRASDIFDATAVQRSTARSGHCSAGPNPYLDGKHCFDHLYKSSVLKRERCAPSAVYSASARLSEPRRHSSLQRVQCLAHHIQEAIRARPTNESLIPG
jgi:hypothetical protein